MTASPSVTPDFEDEVESLKYGADSQELAYLGGLFDGEGSITIIKCSRKYACGVPVTNIKLMFGSNTYWQAARFKSVIGVGRVHNKGKSKLGNYDIFQWSCQGKEVETAIKTLKPHLREKLPQALIGEEFLELMSDPSEHTHGVSEKDALKRLELCNKIQKLNSDNT